MTYFSSNIDVVNRVIPYESVKVACLLFTYKTNNRYLSVLFVVNKVTKNIRSNSDKIAVSSNVDEGIRNNFIFLFFFMKRFYTKKARNSNIDVIMHLGERKYISKQKKTAFL